MTVLEQARSIFGRFARPHRNSNLQMQRGAKRDCKGTLSRTDLLNDPATPVVSGRFSKFYLEKIANLEAQK